MDLLKYDEGACVVGRGEGLELITAPRQDMLRTRATHCTQAQMGLHCSKESPFIVLCLHC
jgi:hypothetical protein